MRGFEGSDASTLYHENFHMMLDDIRVRDPKLAAKFGDALGVKDGVWTREAHELGATEFTAWVNNNFKTSDPVKQSVFQQMWEWLVSSYKSLMGQPKTAERVNPNISRVFEEMLAAPPQMAGPSAPLAGAAEKVGAEIVPAGAMPKAEAEKLAARLTWDARNPATAEKVQHFAANKERIMGQASWEEAPTSILNNMNALAEKIGTLSEHADETLEKSGIILPTKDLVAKINELLAGLKKGKWTEGRAEAITKLEGYLYGEPEKGLPGLIDVSKKGAPYTADLTGAESRVYVQDIRRDIDNFFEARGGKAVKKEDYAVYQFQQFVDGMIKSLSPEYKAEMEVLAPLVRAKHNFLGSFRSDASLRDSFTRAIERDLYREKVLPGESRTMRPYFKQQSQAVRDFSEATGVDYTTWYKDVSARAALFKDLAKPADAGTATAVAYKLLLHGITSPMAATKTAALEAGKFLATGEKPEILQVIQRKMAEKALMGDSAGAAGVNRLGAGLRKAIRAGSDIFAEKTPLRKILVPASVKAMQLLDPFENVDERTHHIETMIALERARNDADAKIKSAVSGVFSEEPSTPTLSKKHTDFLSEQTPEKHGKEWQSISKDVNQLINDPKAFAEKITESTAGLDDAAPGVATGISMTAMRALQLLSEKLDIPQRGLLDTPFVPSKLALTKVAKTMRLINNPFLALEELKQGTLSRDTKEVLMRVFPELNAHMQASVMQEVVKRQTAGAKIPMRKRLALSYFLDQDLDNSMSSPSMSKNFATMSGARAGGPNGSAPPAPPRPRPSSARNLHGGDRLSTPLERVANR